jgi:putative endonuclease
VKKDGSLCKGFTTNIENRLLEHNLGKSKYTSTRIPWKLIHIEEFDSHQLAVKREKYFKSAAGRRWIKKNVFGRAGSPPETT